jgi:hypothetical protein
MKSNLKKRLLSVSIFLGFLGIIIGGGLAHDSYLANLAEHGIPHGTGCHDTHQLRSDNGTITITPVASTINADGTVNLDTLFNITVKITGFVECLGVYDTDRGNTSVVAFAPTRGDNEAFVVEPWTLGEIDLNEVTGDSAEMSLQVLSPDHVGEFNLIVDAMNGDNTTGGGGNRDALGFVWVTDTLTITVAGAAIPGFDMITILAAGFIGIIPIVMIILRKKRVLK